MLTCFPDPYPDEIFYSICARYSERMRYQSRNTLKRDLFGNSEVIPAIALPCHLAALVENLPCTSRYSVDRFIDEHTLFPLFSPFLSQEQLFRTREDMEGEKGSFVYARTGFRIYG